MLKLSLGNVNVQIKSLVRFLSSKSTNKFALKLQDSLIAPQEIGGSEKRIERQIENGQTNPCKSSPCLNGALCNVDNENRYVTNQGLLELLWTVYSKENYNHAQN